MKKTIIKLIIFSLALLIGIFSFNLAFFISDPKPFELSIYNVELNEYESFNDSSLVNIEKSEPFFKSFEKDEGYYGWFMVDEFKGMPEVWTIWLSDSDDSNEKKPKWVARIMTSNKDGSSNNTDDFLSTSIQTEDNKLSFSTAKISNIEYKFEGEFLKDGHDFETRQKILRGNLQKFVKGKKVAEIKTDFFYFEPYCFN